MTNAIYAATGSATLAYRVVIDGCPYQPVSHPDMADPTGGIGSRREGLKLDGERFSIKADPIACKLDVGGLQIKLVDIDNVWSLTFDVEPSATTWLASAINATATTITGGGSTSLFVDGGYAWIDGECFSYAHVSGNDFQSCTRGALSADTDAAQWHYITDGARQRTPAITNWPVLWEGRRVTVYRYDDGDLLTGDGTQIYRGVITTGPRFDGTTWTLGVDHMVSVLEQTFGEDLSEPLTPRGIHYTTQYPFVLNWYQRTAGGSNYTSGGVTISAFYETQDAFCAALTTAFATSFTTGGGLGTVTAVSEGTVGWHLRYHTAAGAGVREMSIQIASPLDPPLGAVPDASNHAAPVAPYGFGFPQNAVTDVVGDQATGVPLVADTDYFFFRPSNAGVYVETGLGAVPRGSYSYNDDTDGRTIYLGGGTPFPTVTSAAAKGTDLLSGDDYDETYEVTSSSASARTITIAAFQPFTHFFAGDAPEIRLGLKLQTASAPRCANVADMLDYVAANAAQYGTLGILPGLRTEDYDSTAWHDVFDSLPPINTQRFFVTFSPVSLADIVREELKAAACFLALDNMGRLVPKRLRLPAASEWSAIATIDSSTLLTSRQRVTHEVSGLGQINQIKYSTGFNPSTGNFDGDNITVRDVAAFGQSPSVRVMEIGQKSQYFGAAPIGVPEVLAAMGSPIFGALSGSYSVDTIDAAKSESAAVGNPIEFDDPYLVETTGTDAATGYPGAALGVTGRVGIVLGKEWEAYSPETRYTVLNTKQKIAGYAPEAFVSAQTNTSGNTWSITLASTYFPTGSTAADFYAAGDLVRVLKWNNATAAAVAGTVVSVASNVIVVTFGSAWTPGAVTWLLSLQGASAVVSTQMKYCFIADVDGLIDNGGANQSTSKVFAP